MLKDEFVLGKDFSLLLSLGEFEMKPLHRILILILVLLTAIPAVAQVPRSVFVEMGSATW